MRRFLILMTAAFLVLPLSGSPYRKALETRGDFVPANEVRALWVARELLKKRETIRAVIETMQRNRFNTAIVQVRGRGDAFYKSDFVPPAADLEEGLDPLAEFLSLARARGIRVHAWVNMFLGADSQTKRTARSDHLIYSRRNWFLRDRTGRSMLDYSSRELKAAGVEGMFLDPANPEVRAYNLKVIREILAKYSVDGIHLDYIRYPFSKEGSAQDFGLDSAAAAFRVDARNAKLMREARNSLVTQMVSEARADMRMLYPGRTLTAAVWPNRTKIEEHVFQPWPDWLHSDLLDHAYLMAYYDTERIHDERLERFYDPLINGRMIIGVGIYRNPKPEVILHQIRSARAMGAAGFCYFQASWFLAGDVQEKERKYALPLRIASGQTSDF